MPNARRILLLVTALIGAAMAAPAAANASADAGAGTKDLCRDFKLVPIDDHTRSAVVDHVWSGTQIGYGGVDADPNLYFGYYNARRQLTVAHYHRPSKRMCHRQLPSTFGGWDSHNSVVMTVDKDGYLHVAGNMHSSPLVYSRAHKPGAIDGMHLSHMIGKDEARTSYPTFLTLSDGTLLFLYREGGSGDGRWIVNRYDQGQWLRLHDTLFAGQDERGPISAYPSNFVRDARGRYHVAIVWRRSAEASTNFAVSYAATRDFEKWTALDGSTLSLPLSPKSADLVEYPDVGSGLRNPAQLVLSPDQQPIISFSRHISDGRSTVFIAQPFEKRWVLRPILASKLRVPMQGYGTLPKIPAFYGPSYSPDGQSAWMDIVFPDEEAQRVPLSLDTLTPSARPQPRPQPVALNVPLPKMPELQDPVENLVGVLPTDLKPRRSVLRYLRYLSQAINRDQARACTPEWPRACNPPPALLYYSETRR